MPLHPELDSLCRRHCRDVTSTGGYVFEPESIPDFIGEIVAAANPNAVQQIKLLRSTLEMIAQYDAPGIPNDAMTITELSELDEPHCALQARRTLKSVMNGESRK